ncbi:vascular cell adhesion protein 1-like, partial [Mya arenaria]|uniref:vascular cell adhesion protein 1-like n=1 Tax=Mya arenaria TaxID=6604 RepID=UPI0022E6ACDA
MGVYVCYIKNTTGVFVATTINLVVEYPATIFEVSFLKNVATPEDDKTMVAVVDGYPFPYTSLTNQNTEKIWFNLTGTGNITFRMKNVTCGDSGKYEIRSSNSWGADTKYETLLIEEPPVFDLDESSNTKQFPRIGDSINLLVKIEGCPKPLFIWSHGVEMIPHKDTAFTTTANISVSNADAFGE